MGRARRGRPSKAPLASVGGAGLGAVALVAFMEVLAGLGVTNFAALVGLAVAVLTFLGGYVPPNYKSLYTAAAALVAVVLAALLAPLLGYDVDTALISAAVIAFAQAAIQYITTNRHPDAPPLTPDRDALPEQ